MARKKKRSAKQLANDRRLGRMAKARAKAKRGGRRKVAKKNPHRYGITPKGRAKVAKIKAAKRKVSAKSHLWNIFKCYGKQVRYLGLTTDGKIQWTIRDAAVIFKSKEQAAKIAVKISQRRGMSKYQIGVSNGDTTGAQIAARCNAGK